MSSTKWRQFYLGLNVLDDSELIHFGLVFHIYIDEHNCHFSGDTYSSQSSSSNGHQGGDIPNWQQTSMA